MHKSGFFRYLHKETYYEKLAYMIMEAEMSRDLQSVEGYPGEPICSFQYKGWVSCDAGKANVSVLRQEKSVLQLEGSQAGGLPSCSWEGQPVCSMQVFNGLDAPLHMGEGNLLYSVK